MSDSEHKPEKSVFRSLLGDLDTPPESSESVVVLNSQRTPEKPADPPEASDRAWRNERYRLLSEIDHLRATLDRMRGRLDQAERLQRQFQEVQCYNEELEARWKQHVHLSGSEVGTQDQGKALRIEELEEQVVGLLERSANGDRDRRAVRDKMEATLEAAKRSLEMEAERKFRSSEARWMRERRSLVNEIENLKKEVTPGRSPAGRARPSLLSRFFRR